jgi:hypothetical protein
MIKHAVHWAITAVLWNRHLSFPNNLLDKDGIERDVNNAFEDVKETEFAVCFQYMIKNKVVVLKDNRYALDIDCIEPLKAYTATLFALRGRLADQLLSEMQVLGNK